MALAGLAQAAAGWVPTRIVAPASLQKMVAQAEDLDRLQRKVAGAKGAAITGGDVR